MWGRKIKTKRTCKVLRIAGQEERFVRVVEITPSVFSCPTFSCHELTAASVQTRESADQRPAPVSLLDPDAASL